MTSRLTNVRVGLAVVRAANKSWNYRTSTQRMEELYALGAWDHEGTMAPVGSRSRSFVRDSGI